MKNNSAECCGTYDNVISIPANRIESEMLHLWGLLQVSVNSFS